MNSESPLPIYKKLSVTFRVEAGCMGPDGLDHIVDFCKYATKDMAKIEPQFTHWSILPRSNKLLPEMEYKINGKKINQKQAEMFLKAFGKTLDNFEETVQDKLAELIDDYLGR